MPSEANESAALFDDLPVPAAPVTARRASAVGNARVIMPNRSQIVINLQKPLQEVWLAARCGGFHYKFDAGRWMDTKGQGEFWESLSRYASEQSGQSLRFGA